MKFRKHSNPLTIGRYVLCPRLDFVLHIVSILPMVPVEAGGGGGSGLYKLTAGTKSLLTRSLGGLEPTTCFLRKADVVLLAV